MCSLPVGMWAVMGVDGVELRIEGRGNELNLVWEMWEIDQLETWRGL